MSEGTSSSTPASESAKPAASSAPPKSKKNLWLMIVAIIVAIVLIVSVVLFTGILGGKDLKATIDPDPVEVDAGAAVDLSVTVEWKGDDVTDDADVDFMWSVDPANLGDFDYQARADVTFTAAVTGGEGTIECEVTYNEKTVTASVDLTVNPPILDSVLVTPSSLTVPPDEPANFTATALSSVALPIAGATFTWSVTGMASGEYELSSTTGTTVEFTGLVEGHANLTATCTYNSVTKSGTADITVGVIPPRSVDYRFYDLLNVPFEEWWDLRWETYHVEQPISDEYPYLFYWYSQPPGNTWIYGNMRMEVDAKNVTKVNMNSWPEFLPYLGTARGGNAEIDWYMQYLTLEEMERYPGNTQSWADGWVVGLNGTVTLDRQAAMAVLNVTSAGFDDFDTWWGQYERDTEDAYSAWWLNEGNERLDIYNAYEYALTLLTFNLTAEKVGDNVVVTYDTVSWGMEMMLTRWVREAFEPVEHYFEDFTMKATIGPERSDIYIDTAIAYGVYAYETTVPMAGLDYGAPCWVFELYPQDYVESTIAHPYSEFDPYVPFTYLNTGPGSMWYGQNMPYDYTPGPFNLTENESMVIEWPAGVDTVFKEQVRDPVTGEPVLGEIRNWTSDMVFKYSEYMGTDADEIAPGTFVVDEGAGVITITGPIDAWTWSKDQTKHDWLADEWDRLGMIPYGIPYIEWEWNVTEPPEPDYFVVSAPSTAIADEAVSVTVTCYDQYDNVYSYIGTLNFTSTDAAAQLPGNYTFLLAEAGVHTYDNLTLGTAGAQTVTVVDSVDPLITGSADITVAPAATADYFVVSAPNATYTLDVAENITVTVYDQYDRLYTDYVGTVVFDSNRSAEVTLPASVTFPGGVDHVTVDHELTFHAEGWFLVYANDSADNTITGQLSIQVIPTPPELDHFVVTGETALSAGQYYDITVTAYDNYGYVFTGYQGTVTFVTDAAAGTYELPADYPFVPADSGVKVFTAGMEFDLAGLYYVNVSDTSTGEYGRLENIAVTVAPEMVYTVYDFFQQPWGEWFWNPALRTGTYGTDYILSNETGKYTMVYNPDGNGEHGAIMAPYRFNMTGENVTNVNVHNPELMPTAEDLGYGIGPQAGAEAKMHVRMEYLDLNWWFSYWYPTWGGGSPVLRNYYNNTNEGYLLGTIYTVELNREAAYEWLGMPTGDDPAVWWAANQLTYEDDWTTWIDNEGNVRLDIYCGYEDFYYPEYTWTDMVVDGDGDIILTVAHVSFGYEVLLTRWLTECQLLIHEPYWEDVDIYASLGGSIANVTFDGVAQYNFHAVKANASAGNDGAWVWDPTRIDYIPSWANFPATHPSDYDPYVGPTWLGTTTFMSWNSGDPLFGTEVEYDATPQWFNLSEHQTLIVKLPQGADVICYLGQATSATSIINLSAGDSSDFDAITYTGTADLGYVVTNPADPYDLVAAYDSVNKILTFEGPYNFDNPGGRTGILYHGAPWIEFNVSSTASTASVVEPAPEVTGSASGASAAEMASIMAAVCGVLVTIAAIACARRW